MCSLCYSGLRAWGRYAQRHSALKVEGTPRDPMNKAPRPMLHWLTFSTNSNNGNSSGYSNKLVILAIIVMVEGRSHCNYTNYEHYNNSVTWSKAIIGSLSM